MVFIEFWRGVPLITVLFFATYMLPLFLPGNWKIDALLRVLIGVVLFSAAYMAEVVRGGLQAIPRGQFEGAMALGLGYWRMMVFVILPQALRARHSRDRQFVHLAVQGHDAGADRVRSSTCSASCAPSSPIPIGRRRSRCSPASRLPA